MVSNENVLISYNSTLEGSKVSIQCATSSRVYSAECKSDGNWSDIDCDFTFMTQGIHFYLNN